jgi:hypothetical protein
MLLIQGKYDQDGGIEAKNKYGLSTVTDLFFVETNHDFNLNANRWKTVLCKISTTIIKECASIS